MPTQAERSATTRAKLLDATAECLAELGYARTSTTEVARRAGVSRGAQLHHFPTKAELVAAAVDHVLERRVEEFRTLIATVPDGPDRVEAAIDLLWSMFQGPTFDAWYELTTAARTDPELRPHVARVADLLDERVRDVFHDLFAPPPGHVATPIYHDVAPAFLFAVLEGLATQRVTGGTCAGPNAEKVLAALKYLASEFPIHTPSTGEVQP
ncbi:TetR/AcrR family transcriptional regulator [Rhabdothermincola sp.]|uniref:TetR/AcrR family transcriptional regulator n=1 Tax=Rhabdothermincola sp. TaxID=2820405 RepID=UPI002FE0CD1F